MALAVRLLGTPTIEHDGVPRPGPRGHKPWALLALLLLADKPVGRDRLAELMFGDADDPLASLRWNLAELRRALGPDVTIEGDPVVIQLPADAEVDVRIVANGTWEAAIALPELGHELLEGIAPAATAAFEAWLLAERRHYAGASAGILREAAIARLASGDAPGAVALATRLVAIDEFDEEAFALLIRAHVAAGNRAEAQRYLRATIERFRGDLGIEPTATLLRSADGWSATLPAGANTGTRAGAESLIMAGEAAIHAGAIDAGLDTLRRAVSDAEVAGDRSLIAKALVTLGSAYIHGARGFDGEGSTALHAGLAVAEDLGNSTLVSEACRELGYVEMLRARYNRAESWLRRAVEEAPDAGSRAAALGVSGAVAFDRGQSANSIEILDRSLAEASPNEKPRLAAWSYAFLGRAYLLRDELVEAREALEAAVAMVRASGWMTFLSYPQALLGAVDLAEGRLDVASEAFESAFALGCQIGDPCWEGIGARGIGLVRIARGEVAEGMAWLADGRDRSVRIPDTYLWIHGYCLDALCEQSIAHGLPEAERWVAELEAAAARTGMHELLVRAFLHRAALGSRDALESAAIFSASIDNPAVLRRVREAAPVAA
jgi:DNA-binding SARP family transcriptional activator